MALARALVMAVLAIAPLSPGVIAAQGDPLPIIQMMQTVTGLLDDDTPELRWQFEAEQGDQVSLLVAALSGDLDAYVQLIDEAGRLLAENDDVAYPDIPDAALEAVTIPRDGIYTIRVTRFGFAEGDTQGEFYVTLLPAYAGPFHREIFAGDQTWVAEPNNNFEVTLRDEQLELDLSATNAVAWAGPDPALALPSRAYVQVEAEVANEADYWEFDLIFRQRSSTSFYLFAVSSRGDWAFLARTGDSTWVQVQDWTVHPALIGLERQATLGVVMDGNSYTFYVDGVMLGMLSADTLGWQGALALGTGTVDQQEIFPIVRYDNLLVTEPLPAAVEAEDAPDTALASWDAPDSAPIIDELMSQGLLQQGGSQVMLVPDSFTTVSRAGIQFLPLGQGRTQADFVLGSTLRIDSESPQNSCGLVFRRLNDDRYSIAFVDSLGGAGVSAWQGSSFAPAFYSDTAVGAGDLSQGVKLLIVAQGDSVRVYVDGELLASRVSEPLDGVVGIASLSYDDIFVNCQFGNTWLWAWD